jgi:hypothetical protein
MNAHTPGPWMVDLAGCETSHGLPIVTKANGHLLAMLAERNEANARLIAELLRCLEGLTGLAEKRPGHLHEYKAAVQDARAAIAKAEGRTP